MLNIKVNHLKLEVVCITSVTKVTRVCLEYCLELSNWLSHWPFT